MGAARSSQLLHGKVLIARVEKDGVDVGCDLGRFHQGALA
jgi:hypothetical protein